MRNKLYYVFIFYFSNSFCLYFAAVLFYIITDLYFISQSHTVLD